MNQLLELILSQKGMKFATFVDQKTIEHIDALWTQAIGAQSTLTEHQITDFLQAYQSLGLLVSMSDRAKEASQIAGTDPETKKKTADVTADTAKSKAGSTDPESLDLTAYRETTPPDSTALELQKSVSNDTADASLHLLFQKNRESDPLHPLMILSDPLEQLPHHPVGSFHPDAGSFSFRSAQDGTISNHKVLQVDRRFLALTHWLSEKKLSLKLSGRYIGMQGNLHEQDIQGMDQKGQKLLPGFCIYKLRIADSRDNRAQQTALNDFLQLVIRRMLASDPHKELPLEEDEDRDSSDHTMIMTDLNALIDYVHCADEALPSNIRNWAHRQISMIRSDSISPEERKHAQRALSIMLNVQWKGGYFPSIDPKEARSILDEELYGMEEVKQRIVETVIQINRTHTLPNYGLLLVGPAGTGKSRIAYAVARILKLPWTSLDMSAIRDPEALTGSPRVYSNAKPGKIMEAFQQAGSSNLVFIINELDKSSANNQSGNSSDALLTLLDNIGFTDNYVECMIPTSGVYPIATANEASLISAPLRTRFAEIHIRDYTADEKKIIFRDYSLRRIKKRMGISKSEVFFTDSAIDAIIDHFSTISGVRDLEQAAEHLLAHALYLLETEGLPQKRVVYEPAQVLDLLN